MTDKSNLRLQRARPVIALAAVAFVIGAIVGVQKGASASDSLGQQFVTAWTHADYASMYSDIDASSKRSVSASEFASAYQQALRTATALHLSVTGKPSETSAGVRVPTSVQTRLFGTLALPFELRTVEESGQTRIAWTRSMTFPGLREGERLSRRMTLPPRASLLARDGSVLAEGSSRVEAGPAGSRLESSHAGKAHRDGKADQGPEEIIGWSPASNGSRDLARVGENPRSDDAVEPQQNEV